MRDGRQTRQDEADDGNGPGRLTAVTFTLVMYGLMALSI